MTGYTRADSVNNIADGNIINASDLDGEFDAVQAAFNSSTGHVHDGTAANGAPITKIGPTQDVVASATAVTPKTTATVDVGSSALKFKDFFFSGTGTLVGLTGTGAITLNTTTNNQSYTTTGAGTITISSGTTGTIDGMNIGATTAGTGRFSSITNTGLTSGRVVYSTTGGLETDSAGLTFDGTNFATTGTATAAKLIPTGSSATGNGLYLPAANSVGISTNGTNAVYIDASQNVGIGTSSPSPNKLQVSGDGCRIAAQCATNSASSSTEAELEAQVYNYWGGTGGPTYTGTAIQQYGAAATGTTAGVSNANLGTLRFQNGAGGLIYTNGGSPLIFATTATERMRIDSSGNVGIGVSTVATNFRTQFLGTAGSNTSAASSGTTQSASAVLRLQAGGGFTGTLDIGQGGGTGSWLQSTDTANLSVTYPLLLNPVGGSVGIGVNSPASRLHIYVNGSQDTLFNLGANQDNYISTGASGVTVFRATTTERMRIDSSGNVLVGTTATSNTDGVLLGKGGAAGGGIIQLYKTASGATNGLLNYYGTTYVGGINFDNTSTSFPTSSDKRLKKDISNSASATQKIDDIRIVSHGWKHDEAIVDFGIIAQDLYEIMPRAVSKGDDEAEIQTVWSVDYSKLVPLLIKAHQEQQALITSLTARITALEST